MPFRLTSSLAWVRSGVFGRMALAYPRLPLEVLRGAPSPQTKQLHRTFSDCTNTAPHRGAVVSGCYLLDPHYKKSPKSGIGRAQESAGGIIDAQVSLSSAGILHHEVGGSNSIVPS